MTFPFPHIIAGLGGVPKGTVEYLGSFSSAVSGSTQTISGINLGIPDPSRVMGIAWHSEGGSANSRNWSRLDGVDRDGGRWGVWGAHTGGIEFYTRPSGLTGSFAANFAATKSRMIASVFALYGFDVAGVDTTSSVSTNAGASSRSTSISHPAKSLVLAQVAVNNSSRSIAWGSDLSEVVEQWFGGYTYSVASRKKDAAGTATASASWSGSYSCVLRGLVIPEL
jgi:hypothetical protein